MSALLSLLVVAALVVIALVGAGTAGLEGLFGIAIPYVALALFVVGLVYRVILWARAPEPFRIPTTSGQQKSLDWIPSNKLDNPHSTAGVIGRMALEILFFRSLFKNTAFELREGPRLVYGAQKYLWVGALAFHWSFLIILIRHLRFFTTEVPGLVRGLQALDGFFQIGVPILLLTDIVIVAALTFLLFRRIFDSKIRYISLPADYFPLFLILGIAISGIIMRYTPLKAELVQVKALTAGLLSFQPAIPDGINSIFYVHLFLVCTLLAYFPFSKLAHMAGVFLSPTRNLANNNRAVRHVNPWNAPVAVHTYDEWEEEFKEKLKASGYTLEKE